MKCLVCHSDETEWVETVMDNVDKGYMAYACKACGSRSEFGFRIQVRYFTGFNDVFPAEKE